MCAWQSSESRSAKGNPSAAERRALGLLLEGAAINLPQVDAGAFRRFRSAILRGSIQLIQPQTEPDLLKNVAGIVQEFALYRTDVEHILEDRKKEWRAVAGLLFGQLGLRDKIDPKSALWMKLATSVVLATTSEEIQAVHEGLRQLFRVEEAGAPPIPEIEEEQDRSTANDNAAGLRGGGAAIEHVRAMIADEHPGYVALFRLSCLDVVGERFGPEGIQDCLIAVSAFLIQNLRAEDIVYHWSESSLLAILDRKIREDMMAAELNRVLARNREFTINIDQRAIMLRIPVELQLFPIAQIASVDDLIQLCAPRKRADRALPERAHPRGIAVKS